MAGQQFDYRAQENTVPAGAFAYQSIAPADARRFILILAAQGGRCFARPKGLMTGLAVGTIALEDGASETLTWRDWGDLVGWEWEGGLLGGAGGTITCTMGTCA